MNIALIAQSRYSTKSFDPARKIPSGEMAQLETVLRLSPSSTNTQPWHFVVASTEEGKKRIAKSTTGFFLFNEQKILNASHVVVFCLRWTLDDAYLKRLLDKEDADGRFATQEVRDMIHKGRCIFVDSHRFNMRDEQHWMEKQLYLALGTLLLGAGAIGVDACPIEGFDRRTLDEELGLNTRGLTSSVLVSLGYRSDEDFNARLPKSRLDADEVISHI